MSTVAQNVYGRVETLIELPFANAYAVVETYSKNNRSKVTGTRIYRKSDIIVNKNGRFKFRKYHDCLINNEMIPDVPWYLYLNDKFFDEVDKGEKYYTEIDFMKYDESYKLAMFKIRDPKVDNLIYPCHDSHMFIRYHDFFSGHVDYPLSSLYIFDYIGMFNNMELKLDEAFEHLKKHPWVKDVKKVDIPYYNVSPGMDKGLNLKVLLPQEEHDKLWKRLIDGKSIHRSSDIKGMIQSCCWIDRSIDPLGIRQFQRTHEEKHKRYQENSHDENY